MDNEKRVVHILWTGGLESTFRMVELSRKDCIIQPHYIIMRKTAEYELNAIKTISAILQRDKRTSAKILPVIISEGEQISFFTDIQFVWDSLQELKHFKSGQYQALACYARDKNLKLEMGLQFSENGSVVKILDESVLIDDPDFDDVMMIDPEKGIEEWASYTLFKDFLFPKSLFHKTKSEEIEELKAQGYDEVLKHIWSCYHPIFGMPCGHCFPCRSAKKEGAGQTIPFWGNFFGAIIYYVKTILKVVLPSRISDGLKNIYHKFLS